MMEVVVDDREWQKMMVNLANLSKEAMDVGFMDTKPKKIYDGLSAAEVMTIQEWGAKGKGVKIPARNAMRGYFRSLRGNGGANSSKMHPFILRIANKVIRQGYHLNSLKPIANPLKEGLKKNITGGDFVDNKASTVRGKGFNHPLVHTGNLSNEVSTKRGRVYEPSR